MAALEAALVERMRSMAGQKEQVAAKVRLICDPGLSVSELESCLTIFLREKNSNDLWSFVAPPAGGPQTYGWHSLPCPEWVAKCAGLLFSLVSIAKNTKINSTKLTKALKGCHDRKDLDAMLAGRKGLQDNLEKLDFTIRVLLSMIRQLKCNKVLRQKTLRALAKKEQLAVELILEKVELPASLLQEEEVESQETVTVEPDALALVPYGAPVGRSRGSEACKQEGASSSRGLSVSPFPALPTVFGNILQEGGKEAICKLPSSTTLMRKKSFSHMEYVPEAVQKKVKEPKPPKAPQQKKKEKALVKKKPGKQDVQASVEDVGDDVTYSAGKYREIMNKYIGDYMDRETSQGRCGSKSEARLMWAQSLQRAHLLKGMAKEATENPFEARIAQADVD